MNANCREELVAYSVQDVGPLWRWRVYRVGGQVAHQGVELTEALAERAAATVFSDAVSPAA